MAGYTKPPTLIEKFLAVFEDGRVERVELKMNKDGRIFYIFRGPVGAQTRERFMTSRGAMRIYNQHRRKYESQGATIRWLEQ